MERPTMADVPTLDQYWQALQSRLRPFSSEDRQAAVVLYRELSKGQAVNDQQFGDALGISAADARTILDRDAIKTFIYPDEQGRVLGFGGLAVTPMHHLFEVDDRARATCCASDT